MKKLIIPLSLLVTNTMAVVPVEVTVDAPAALNNTASKADGLTTLSGLIDSVAKAQNIQQQMNALKNLSDFQKNPGSAVQQTNNAVTGLLNNFNSLNNSHINNLSSLINSLAGSSTATGMNMKLNSAANMQLSAIHNQLQILQAQQQAMIAYKQAELADEKASKEQAQKNTQATYNKMSTY